MPLLILFFLLYGLGWIIALPFKLVYWVFVGLFVTFGNILYLLGEGWDALWCGDGSVVGAKLVTVASVVGLLIYLITKYA